MSSWVVVPCLLTLRDEFNYVSPNRDKGADGTIGDSAHTSSSDHTPDEDSDVLRSKDADSKNEVHGLDIDSTGPWPWSFDSKIKAIVAQERSRWLDPNDVCRLQNVIWNGKIASVSWDFEWRDYDGSDPHTNHAHFSARYLTQAENDTRPWGVKGGCPLMGVWDSEAEYKAYHESLISPTTKGIRNAVQDDEETRAALIQLYADGMTEWMWRGLHYLRNDSTYQNAPESSTDPAVLTKKKMRSAGDTYRIMWRAAFLAETSKHAGTAPPLLPIEPPPPGSTSK